MSASRIVDLPAHVGRDVSVAGWITGSRSSGKIAFLALRDGSGFVQAVVSRADVAESTFDAARALGQESAVRVHGEVRADPRSPGGVELAVRAIEVVHATQEYPITPKEHGVEFLADHRHLHLRHRAPWAILRIRDEVERAIHEFFGDRGFIRFDAPLFMPTAVEGTTNLFEIDLFDEGKAYLSQSGQLYAEAGAMAHGAVYTMGPTFRAEKSKTRRHLLEFWMIEPEVAYLEHDGNVALQIDLVSFLVRRVLERRGRELEILGRDVSRLAPAAEGNFPIIRYDDALTILAEAGMPIEWGEDFGAPHETAIGDRFDRPVVIERYPAHIKAFYMQPDPANPKVALCNDMIAPEGYGELIGGSQRIHDVSLLERRIAEHDLPREAFGWYLDLRRFGSVPHAGFGIGLERTLAWITGVHHLREVIPFPRMLTRMTP